MIWGSFLVSDPFIHLCSCDYVDLRAVNFYGMHQLQNYINEIVLWICGLFSW